MTLVSVALVATALDDPPPGAVRRLGSRQMREAGGTLGDYTADGRTLFTAGLVNGIREWDTGTNTLRRVIPVRVTNIRHLRVTPDGKTLVADDFRTVLVWDRGTGELRHRLTVEGESATCLAVSPSGATVAVGTFEGSVRLFDIGSGKPLPFAVRHPKSTDPADNLPPVVASVAWSPDGRTLLSSARPGDLRAWDPDTGAERWSLHPLAVSSGSVGFTPDGKQFLAPIRDAARRHHYALWDATTRRKTADLAGFGAGYCLAVSRDGRYFASGGGGGFAQVWDTRANAVTFAPPVSSSVSHIAFSPDGKRLACASGGVHLYDLETRTELFDATGHAGMVLALSATPDGKIAATGGHDCTARVWDMATGALRHTLRVPGQSVGGVSVSPDGRTVATGASDGTVRLHDLATGRVVWAADGHSQLVQVTHSPDGRTVAVGGGNLTVHLYDAATGAKRRALVGYNGGMNTGWHFAWTPDSRGIVSPVALMPPAEPGFNQFAPAKPVGGPGGEGDGLYRIVLWDAATGDRLRVVGPAEKHPHRPVAVDPTGRYVAVGGEQLSLVDLTTGERKWAVKTPSWYGLAFVGEGKLYAGGTCPDAATGQVLSKRPIDVGLVIAPPTGGVVLTATQFDNTVVVWPK